LLYPYPVRVVPGIYLLGGLAPAAAYVVETSEGLVLIDAGLDQDARLLKEEMNSLRLDWRRIRAILLTHAHGDHSGGAAHLRAATGAKVYAGQGDAAVLRAGGPREAFFGTRFMPNPTPGPTAVDVELGGPQTIAVGDAHFRALATPGHTPGSVCYLLERGGQRVLFAGDVVMSLTEGEGSGAVVGRPLGTYAAYLAPRYRGDGEAFLSTLRQLRALPAPDLVLPGHPRMDNLPESPALAPGRWEALLDQGIREMERLQTRYARDGANFLDDVPKQLLPGLYYLGDLEGGAVYGLFASSKFYLVNAPGKRGWSAFLSARLRQVGREPAAPDAVLLTSGDPEATAGLAELVAAYRPQVVAPAAAREAIGKVSPAGVSILAAEDLAGKGWFPVTTAPLRGRGGASVAYLLEWAGKSVLFSGAIPIKSGRAAEEALRSDFQRGRGDVADYCASLQRLGGLKPDLWLPVSPCDGQNANLYDTEWKEILAKNQELCR
jgi:glyoxylase-like metal-dependent hydrolase (beta-lactamase superfamily II)